MKVLLVSPAFHGYWHAIQSALESLGHDVRTHRYDASSPSARFGNAVAHRIPGSGVARRVRSQATEAAVRVLAETKPDAVLVIKGDALGYNWWQALSASGAHSVLWLYDELARMAYEEDTLRQLGAVLSYSPRDVHALRSVGIEASVLPDGYDSLTAYTAVVSDEVTFVGARYPARERMMRSLHDNGQPVKAFGREWSRHPWDVIRTRRWQASGVPSARDVDRARYYGVMAGSLATLNIHGDGHDGFSMRTFEAPGVGAVQLIDRPDVDEHYEIGKEALVFTSDEELLELVQRVRREPEWAKQIREAGQRRTLAEHTLVHRMKAVEKHWA